MQSPASNRQVLTVFAIACTTALVTLAAAGYVLYRLAGAIATALAGVDWVSVMATSPLWLCAIALSLLFVAPSQSKGVQP